MIKIMKNTSAQDIAAFLDDQREQQGAGVLGRVLTLLVCVPGMIDVGTAREICSAASREHPCRVIIVVEGGIEANTNLLNAEIRTGESAGASEVIVLEPKGEVANNLDTLVMPLLLSDVPIVVYWPFTAPKVPSAHPLGRMATKRITDVRSGQHPVTTLRHLASVYSPGDNDLAWSAITLWRALLSSIMDQCDGADIETALISGNLHHPAPTLTRAWLESYGIECKLEHVENAATISGVRFFFSCGEETALSRPEQSRIAELTRTGKPATLVKLARRTPQDCLMEELRRFDPDEYYATVLELLKES
ncbi:MAG: glucose-6-phosphate dehydrogenase assembly protein OpcA [Actinomycetaceae bacterium]|nr:glucose-6-phosphate dehydrogenase assembly protein OpcA [Actinomycetaceae bacterium]